MLITARFGFGPNRQALLAYAGMAGRANRSQERR